MHITIVEECAFSLNSTVQHRLQKKKNWVHSGLFSNSIFFCNSLWAKIFRKKTTFLFTFLSQSFFVNIFYSLSPRASSLVFLFLSLCASLFSFLFCATVHLGCSVFPPHTCVFCFGLGHLSLKFTHLGRVGSVVCIRSALIFLLPPVVFTAYNGVSFSLIWWCSHVCVPARSCVLVSARLEFFIWERLSNFPARNQLGLCGENISLLVTIPETCRGDDLHVFLCSRGSKTNLIESRVTRGVGNVGQRSKL